MTRFWLIRHAQSRSNAGLPIQGHTRDIPLTDFGHQQAAQVAQVFERPPDLIVHSPYLRAQQTATPTIARFPEVPTEVWPVQEFTYARYDGSKTWHERLPEIEHYWHDADPDHRDGDGYESFTDLLDRIDDTMARLRALPPDTGQVVVFSHCRFIQIFFWRWLVGRERALQTMATFWDSRHLIRIPNTGVIKGQVMPDDQLALTPITTLAALESGWTQ